MIAVHSPHARNAALLLLRIAVASIFLYHGVKKFGMWMEPPAAMPMDMLIIMRTLAVVEPLAGVLLILGLFTEAAATALMVVMIGAMRMKIADGKPFSAWEFDWILFAANAAILAVGPGAWILGKRRPVR